MTKNALIPALTPDSSLSRYMEQIRQFPMLEADEEYMLARAFNERGDVEACLLYTSPSPRDRSLSRMPSSA